MYDKTQLGVNEKYEIKSEGVDRRLFSKRVLSGLAGLAAGLALFGSAGTISGEGIKTNKGAVGYDLRGVWEAAPSSANLSFDVEIKQDKQDGKRFGVYSLEYVTRANISPGTKLVDVEVNGDEVYCSARVGANVASGTTKILENGNYFECPSVFGGTIRLKRKK